MVPRHEVLGGTSGSLGNTLEASLLPGVLSPSEAAALRRWLLSPETTNARRADDHEEKADPETTDPNVAAGPPGWGYHTQGRRQLAFESEALSNEVWSRVSATIPSLVYMGGCQWKIVGLSTGWRGVWYGDAARHAWHCDEAVIGGGPAPAQFVHQEHPGNVTGETSGALRHVSGATLMMYLSAPVRDRHPAGKVDVIDGEYCGGELVWLAPGSQVPSPLPASSASASASASSSEENNQRQRHWQRQRLQPALGVRPGVGDVALVTYDTPHCSLP